MSDITYIEFIMEKPLDELASSSMFGRQSIELGVLINILVPQSFASGVSVGLLCKYNDRFKMLLAGVNDGDPATFIADILTPIYEEFARALRQKQLTPSTVEEYGELVSRICMSQLEQANAVPANRVPETKVNISDCWDPLRYSLAIGIMFGCMEVFFAERMLKSFFGSDINVIKSEAANTIFAFVERSLESNSSPFTSTDLLTASNLHR